MEIPDTMPHPSRALAAISGSLDSSIGTVVCIPCFRRPQHLRLTLESLAGQRHSQGLVFRQKARCATR